MCADKTHTVFLGISHLISFDGFYNSIFFGFETPKKFRCDFFVVNGQNSKRKNMENCLRIEA